MNRWGQLCTLTKQDSISQGVEGDLFEFQTTPKLHVQASIYVCNLGSSDAHPKCLTEKRQDCARSGFDETGHTCTRKCRLEQHLHCCLPGMHFSRDSRWALSMGRAWAAPGISTQSLCDVGKADAGRPQWNGWMPQQQSWKVKVLGLNNSQGCCRRVLESRGSVTFSSAHMVQMPWWSGADPLQATRESFSTPGEVPPPCVPTRPSFPGHTTLCWLMRGRKKQFHGWKDWFLFCSS